MTMKKSKKQSQPAEQWNWVPASTPIDEMKSVIVWCDHGEGVTEWCEAYQLKGVWYDRAACVLNHVTHYTIPTGPKPMVAAEN